MTLTLILLPSCCSAVWISGPSNCPQPEKTLQLLRLWEGDGWAQLERMSQKWNRFSWEDAPALFLCLFLVHHPCGEGVCPPGAGFSFGRGCDFTQRHNIIMCQAVEKGNKSKTTHATDPTTALPPGSCVYARGWDIFLGHISG